MKKWGEVSETEQQAWSAVLRGLLFYVYYVRTKTKGGLPMRHLLHISDEIFNEGKISHQFNDDSISTPWTLAPFAGREISDIDRFVVELLPAFKFRALWEQNEGLGCVVCLTKFEAAEGNLS
ncbi:hypothetical protein D0Y65_015823 [Glycine soja]|uniref:Uncharacterized protein n=1 Tax=Glycine soja TaxID=3848 RepID=A0A445KEX1_GLYSO|nr:hypothetical protein D0Y65_015823 [Glycine soja]